MKFTKESKKLMMFFSKYNCLLSQKQTKNTDAILKHLYQEISNGVSYIQSLKPENTNLFYKLKINNITNISQIPKPTTFPLNAFPKEIIKHIEDYSLSSMTYSFHLFERDISIIFLTEEDTTEKQIKIYNNYVDYMLVWLYIVDRYASKSCSAELKIYIYHTSLLKIMPLSNDHILNENNINTAFTKTCQKNAEIVVFRKEEWFKAFIH